MKRVLAICAACMLLGGCAQKPEDSAAALPEGLTVEAASDVDSAYTDCLRAYFTAIEQNDLAAYQQVLYSPFAESAAAYYEANGSSMEERFQQLHAQFDEDGYESWRFTTLEISYYPEERADIDDFLGAYTNAGMIGEDAAAECKKNAEEIKDVLFTLYALYEGDAEPVAVAQSREILMVKTAEGCFLFG